jgi:hypothetical protein
MPDYHRIVREVSWHDLFPWLLLLRTCRLAAEFRRLFLAALGLVLTGLGWWVIDWALTQHDPAVPAMRFESVSPPGVAGGRDDLGSPLYVPWRETARAFVANWRFATRPVRQLFARPFTFSGFAAALLAAVWAIAVWGFFGGAICRLSAVQLGLDEQLSLASAVRFTLSKWRAFLAAPLMPLGMAFFFTLFVATAGLIARLDLGLLVAGVFWPIALIFGVLVMLLVAGLALGFPLMWAAIGTDGSDSFDAISRSYTYVGQRPLNYLFYALVSLAIGVVGWMIINTLALVTLYLTSWGASLGSGEERWRQIEATSPWLVAGVESFSPIAATQYLPPPWAADATPLEGAGRAGAGLIGFWMGGVRLLALSYAYSFFWTAGTGAYLLLRRDADAVELDEVLVEGDDDPSSLPAVQPDAAGVSVLADEPKEPE